MQNRDIIRIKSKLVAAREAAEGACEILHKYSDRVPPQNLYNNK